MKLIKLLIAISFIHFCISEITNVNPKFLEKMNELSKMPENEIELMFKQEAENSIENIGAIIPIECLYQLKELKNIFSAIKEAKGIDEKIFYGTKTLVDSFPALKEKCKLPLPTVNTSTWTIEKFKKIKCTAIISSFAVTASTCLSGAIFQCPGAVALLKETSECIKQLIS